MSMTVTFVIAYIMIVPSQTLFSRGAQPAVA
jgi:hypothetical protein